MPSRHLHGRRAARDSGGGASRHLVRPSHRWCVGAPDHRPRHFGTEGPLPRIRNPPYCPAYADPRSNQGDEPGASVTDQGTDAFSRRFEEGIPDPGHEPSNRIFGLTALQRTSGRQRSSLSLIIYASIALRYRGAISRLGGGEAAGDVARRRFAATNSAGASFVLTLRSAPGASRRSSSRGADSGPGYGTPPDGGTFRDGQLAARDAGRRCATTERGRPMATLPACAGMRSTSWVGSESRCSWLLP